MFSTRFKEIRNKLGLTQSQMASKIEGIGQPNIVDIERGRSNPSINVLLRLHIIWNINIHWFLTGEGDMFNENNLGVKTLIEENEKLKSKNIELMEKLINMHEDKKNVTPSEPTKQTMKHLE